MIILFITSRLPYPPYRGDKLKIWNLISQLSKRNEIFLATFIQHRSELKWLPIVRDKCKQVYTVYKSTRSSLLSCLKALPTSKPFQVAYFESNAMTRLLERVVNEVKPDIIHTHLIRMAPYALSDNGIPRILDMTDAVSLYLARFRDAQKNVIRRRLIDIEYNRLTSFEPITKSFDRGLVCSESDQKFLLDRNPGSCIEVLQNGVDLKTFSEEPGIQVEFSRITFTGNLDYFPNADAALYFAEEIFPIIRRNQKGAKFYIVGQNPPRPIRRLACEDIIVTGFVENIQREYMKSAVVVSPVRFGAGTLNKVLEPLALGVPVVATSIGTQDLHLINGKDIIITDDPEQFAKEVCRILSDRELRDTIGRSAQARVRSEWSWDKIAFRLEAIYSQILDARVRTSGIEER